ncbi:bifunctional DNA primase/polymerase, partial [bacterium]|nr:bifunctional DNA primase/polymerase [bacterium]
MINKTKLTNFAQEYLTNGISILPIKKDKRPVIKWGKYQEELPTMEEVGEWPLNRSDGLAWVMGEVSGGMETLDFDFKHGLTIDQYHQFEDAVEEKCEGLGEKVLRQKTPTGGRHWIYRCEEIEGNLKLAIGQDGEAIIETRGEGGYICVEPTKDYAFQNEHCEVPQISPEERQILMNVAKSFSIEPVKEKKKKSTGKMDRKEVPSFPPSFIDYSNEHKMNKLVEEDGWVFLDESTDGKGKPVHRYERAGGSDVGASLYPEDNTFYVFTTSSDLPTHQMMNCAEYIMYSVFGGDEEATLRWLEEEGYPNEEIEDEEDRDVRLKLRLKRDIKEKRFISNMVHSIKALMGIRYNVIRQVFECKVEDTSSVARYMDGWNGLDSKAVQGKLLARGIKVPYQKVTFVLADDSHWDKVD